MFGFSQKFRLLKETSEYILGIIGASKFLLFFSCSYDALLYNNDNDWNIPSICWSD